MGWKSGRAYSTDLRSRVLAAVDGGSPAKAVAQLFQVSVSYIYKALGRRAATGETEARPQRNRQTLKLVAHHDAIAAEVARRPDVTLEELRAWLLATHEVAASLGLMHKTLIRLGLTLKKKSGRAEEQDRPDVAEQRATWRARQGDMSPGRLVFVDETGAATNMARRHGRSPRGKRLDGPIPPSDRSAVCPSGGSLRDGHWKSTVDRRWRSTIGGLTTRGLVAPYVLDGALDGAVFLAWVEQMLAPELRPGDLVVMDNLGAHLSAAPTSLRGIRPEAGWSPAAATPSKARARSCATCRHRACPIPRRDVSAADRVAGPEPDRASLRQAESPAAQGRRAHRRRLVDRHRPAARPLPARRVRQLPRPCRLSTLSMKML